jgi:hypothetical protein
MSAGHYGLTIAGHIGPGSSDVFPDFVADDVPRHHVLLIRANHEDLLSLLSQLEENGIEVDRVTAWPS